MLMFLWIFPELAGVLFVVLWPAFYRLVFTESLKRAAATLGLVAENGIALANYNLDLSLAVVSVLNFGFSLFKFIVLMRLRHETYPDAGILVMFIYLAGGVVWLLFLHAKSDPLRYANVRETGVTWLWGLKGEGAVAGPAGRWILWTRWIMAAGALALSIASGLETLYNVTVWK